MQRTTYSLVDPFCFQNEPNSEALIFDSSTKNDLFRTRRIRYFLITSFYYLMCFIKKKTKYTTRYSMKSSTIYKEQLIL
jgi:hypothetical protein